MSAVRGGAHRLLVPHREEQRDARDTEDGDADRLPRDPWAHDDWGQDLTDPPEKELVAFAGADGALTVAGLDTHGRDLNTTSPETPEYSLGGLPANTSFGLALWNAAGDGKSTVAGPVTTNAAGVARFTVPLHAAFALTNVPIS